ncbi:RNA 3'-terminal phosphate cyclase [Methylococcus capsulatus str. Bath]|uniref:RNA 3'-terminal phosphate cyclase n=1 Tax=Methylococcus capsulatus (strain ATCC 33009 / NCIMB 11132 / Bath) TaxID=243233 RepID=RTCA_METCA|nr:RNA 3'-terminal phosphate cyclase [Methylococcus capsulatus]Q609M1.1 RecName: Full=RNA 3'-terminal phosphate cyclase; Short=RNA cyclase; Short=RNA-3'-phosphate cyclase [Methylococcus capsulatus str. Bath]AAU92541.1 RNA 3'-terminal phosphate cyclase [Methylococcus capsulatus str. Bath]
MTLLRIDGSYGEGGGQIIRTALSLAALTGTAVRLENIRARRRKPGLAAQHLTAVKAVALLCDARIGGAELGSQTLEFIPGRPVRAGDYTLDVGEAREGGSAGAVMLVLQTVLPPLALAEGASTVSLRGGTHVPMSPPFDYVREVWLPTLARMGVRAELSLVRSGWYPVGKGEVRLVVAGGRRSLEALKARHRGTLQAVTGRALAANLPAHIPERMAARARAVLADAGIAAAIEPAVLQAACAGAGLFLTARYDHCLAGFTALGRRGKSAERVAEEACGALLAHHRSGAALDQHLADQIVLPAALCREESLFSVERITPHLTTNAWVVDRFGLARVDVRLAECGTGLVRIHGNPAGVCHAHP